MEIEDENDGDDYRTFFKNNNLQNLWPWLFRSKTTTTTQEPVTETTTQSTTTTTIRNDLIPSGRTRRPVKYIINGKRMKIFIKIYEK